MGRRIKLFQLTTIIGLFSLSIFLSNCSEDSTSNEPDPLENVQYNFWDFRGNGDNSVANSPAWETTNIEYGSTTLISEGIYEGSNDPNPERAVVKLTNFDMSKHSLVVNFKVPSSIQNGN